MPTVEEVCATFGLNDVQIEYTDVDYQNLTSYKFFQQHVRPLLARENPKVRFEILVYSVGHRVCQARNSRVMFSGANG